MAVEDKSLHLSLIEQLLEVIEITESSDELRAMLYSPLITIEQKKKLVLPLLEKFNNQYLANFIILLIEKKRIQLLGAIKPLLPKQINSIKNILEVKIHTSSSFTDEEKENVKSLLSSKFNKIIQPIFEDSSDILGGFKATVGDTVYDGRIENSFLRLKTTLKGK